MNRPLSELEVRALQPLMRVSQELRDECVEIARAKSPSAAFKQATRAARLAGFGEWDALGIAKGTRWLSVIRRDYGMEKFNEAVRTLTAIAKEVL